MRRYGEITVDNFTKATLEPRKADLIKARISVRKSLDGLSDNTTDYAEHHQHLINTYSEMIRSIDRAIHESSTIGTGV